MGRSFLILHGWQGSGSRHWQTWLAERLAGRGEVVRYPVLPDPDEPELGPWLAALDDELDALAGDQVRVACHSLGVILWLHHAARGPVRPVDRVLLVAPPSPAVPVVADTSFGPPPDRPDLAAAARSTLLVCSENDPYCPEGADVAYPGIETTLLHGAGHVNVESGYGPWPWAEDWCLA